MTLYRAEVEPFELTATEMLEALRRKELSAVELVDSHLRRIDATNPRINAIVHRFDAHARAAAVESDVRWREGRARPLEGLPITVKESIATAGVPVTLGVVNKKSHPPQDSDAVVVRLAKEAGAIVLGKTNVSQLLLFHESANPLFGVTNNPWDLARVPGGSSGGESAAIAAGMSPMGIGGDIGGSIRVPCAFTGIAGLKPTLDRWSNLGSNTALAGQEVVRGQCGPMARASRDVALLFEALSPKQMAEYDPLVAPIEPVRAAEVEVSRLTIGHYVDDGVVAPSSSVARGVRAAVDAVKALGAKVVEFSVPFADEILETYFGAISSDGGATIEEHLQGEAIAAQLAQLRRVARLPDPVRFVMRELLGLKGERRVSRIVGLVHERSVATHWKLAAKRTELRKRALAHWRQAGVDVVIAPAHATVALRHGDSADFSIGGFPSMIYNLLQFPAGVLPVTRVLATDDPRLASDRVDARARSVELGSTGLPVGVQVIGRPYGDAAVLAVMISVEAQLRRSDGFPSTPHFAA